MALFCPSTRSVFAKWAALCCILLLSLPGPLPAESSATSYVKIIGEDKPLVPGEAGNLPKDGGGVSDEEIEAKIKIAQSFYREKRRKVVARVNTLFQVDVTALMEKYQDRRKEMNLKMAVVQRLPNGEERNRKLNELNEEYQDEDFARFLEIDYYFENEMQKEHQFMGELLEMLEESLDLLLEKEPLFRYVFLSEEFRARHGIVLKRVVWPTDAMKDLAASTVPLDVRTMFADKSKTPLLVKTTVTAFDSLPFLRSVLIHEISNLYFFKESLLEPPALATPEERAVLKELATYVRGMNPFHPTYQDFLLQSYYGFRAQIFFDDRVRARATYRLGDKDRQYFEQMLAWTHSQLSPRHKAFVAGHPNAPARSLIEHYF